jgi:hypothetical protein
MATSFAAPSVAIGTCDMVWANAVTPVPANRTSDKAHFSAVDRRGILNIHQDTTESAGKIPAGLEGNLQHLANQQVPKKRRRK